MGTDMFTSQWRQATQLYPQTPGWPLEVPCTLKKGLLGSVDSPWSAFADLPRVSLS